jgi:hypothetical protein
MYLFQQKKGKNRIMLSTIIGIAIGTFVGRLIFDIWKSRKERRN